MKKRPVKASPAQQRAAQEKRDRFKRFARQLADMTEAERLEMAGTVGVRNCEGHALSQTNTLLAMFQFPKVTVVGGFRQWIANGRAVRKGEHGIMIWVPTANRTGTVSDSDVRFLTANVFDISQTDELAKVEAA